MCIINSFWDIMILFWITFIWTTFIEMQIEMKGYLNITFATALRQSEMFLRPFPLLPVRHASQGHWRIGDTAQESALLTGPRHVFSDKATNSFLHLMPKCVSLKHISFIRYILGTEVHIPQHIEEYWQIMHVLNRFKNHLLFSSPKVHSRSYKSRPETKSEGVQSGWIIFKIFICDSY
jgi:hypothetical protein